MPVPTAVVFVSSNINHPEDFVAERCAAREVIESFPCFEAWVFETESASSEPLKESYLVPLGESAIVVFILGAHLTAAVRSEYDEAHKLEKRTLIFLKSVAKRDPDVDDLIATADVKYAQFATTDEFKDQLKQALAGEISRALTRPYTRHPASPAEHKLRQLLASHRPCYLRPTFPPDFNVDRYTIESVDADETVLQKGSGHIVTVPIDQLVIGPMSGSEPVLLQVQGRIQWLSVTRRWQYLPDRPRDGFGVPKSASPGERRVNAVQESLKSMGHYTQWNLEHEATQGSYQIVYDDDGYYFRNKGRDHRGDQILVMHAP